MKRIIAGVLASALMAAPLTAFAANPITESTEQTGDVTISVEIAPSYTVTIPADTKVKYGDTETAFGKVEMSKARFEPGKCVLISVAGDYALKNKADETKTIPYDVTARMTAEDGETVEGSIKKYGFYGVFAEDSAELTIHISEEDWNKAPAGSYSDVLTFHIGYTDIPKE